MIASIIDHASSCVEQNKLKIYYALNVSTENFAAVENDRDAVRITNI